MNIRAWSISLLLFLSTVTAVGQTANRYLKAPLPNGWEENGEVFQQTLPVDDHWWKSFGDSKLDSLIALAVDRNYSVAMAINRIAAARANLWAERGNFFPSIGLNAGWTRQETSGNTSSIPQTTEHYYDASLSMSWEIDVFGSIRKRVKAQKENFAASKEEYTGVMISMAAEVASAYINLRELQQELEVVNKNCASQEEVLKITEVRYNTGLVAKLDVAQAKSVLYSTKSFHSTTGSRYQSVYYDVSSFAGNVSAGHSSGTGTCRNIARLYGTDRRGNACRSVDETSRCAECGTKRERTSGIARSFKGGLVAESFSERLVRLCGS